MSSLQCPATLLLTAPGADLGPEVLHDRRVTHVWAADAGAGETAAAALGVRATTVPGLGADDLEDLRDALAGIADATPGETTVVLALGGRLRAALPSLARLEPHPAQLATASVLELDVDADDWVCRAGPDR